MVKKHVTWWLASYIPISHSIVNISILCLFLNLILETFNTGNETFLEVWILNSNGNNHYDIFLRIVWWKVWSCLTPSATTNGSLRHLLFCSSIKKICLKRRLKSHLSQSVSQSTQVVSNRCYFFLPLKSGILWMFQVCLFLIHF